MEAEAGGILRMLKGAEGQGAPATWTWGCGGGEGPQREVVLRAVLLNQQGLAGGEKGRHDVVWAHEIIM